MCCGTASLELTLHDLIYRMGMGVGVPRLQNNRMRMESIAIYKGVGHGTKHAEIAWPLWSTSEIRISKFQLGHFGPAEGS